MTTLHDKQQDLRPNRINMWESIYLQCHYPLNLDGVSSVIDFVSGRNLSKAIVEHFGIKYTAVDVSDVYEPDILSEIRYDIDGLDKADFVGCYQCLEHNHYNKFIDLVSVLESYSNKYVCLALPYNGAYLSLNLSLRLPKISKNFSFVKSFCGLAARDINVNKLEQTGDQYRHHYWELGRPSFKVKKVLSDVEENTCLKFIEQRHNRIYPHHIFLLFEKKSAS